MVTASDALRNGISLMTPASSGAVAIRNAEREILGSLSWLSAAFKASPVSMSLALGFSWRFLMIWSYNALFRADCPRLLATYRRVASRFA